MLGYDDLFENETIDIKTHSKKRKEISFSKLYFFEDFADYSPGPDVFYNIFDENYEITSKKSKKISPFEVKIIRNNNHSKICLESKCEKIASFNFPHNRRRLYCHAHKKIGMINVARRKCVSFGCNTIPNFNYPGERTKIFCHAHKKPGMINISRIRKCKYSGCGKYPSFNFPGEKGLLFCSEHKKPGMINLSHTKRKE